MRLPPHLYLCADATSCVLIQRYYPEKRLSRVLGILRRDFTLFPPSCVTYSQGKGLSENGSKQAEHA